MELGLGKQCWANVTFLLSGKSVSGAAVTFHNRNSWNDCVLLEGGLCCGEMGCGSITVVSVEIWWMELLRSFLSCSHISPPLCLFPFLLWASSFPAFNYIWPNHSRYYNVLYILYYITHTITQNTLVLYNTLLRSLRSVTILPSWGISVFTRKFANLFLGFYLKKKKKI